MEQGMEKPKAKPEADYSFDPVSATAGEWETYLRTDKNFEKDFTRGEYPFKLPAEAILEKLREGGTPRKAVETAVEVVLEKWNEFAGHNPFLREINPIEFVARLGDESTLDVVGKLWTDAPKDSPLLHDGLLHVAYGLEARLPVDQEGLEKLYAEHFDTYRFIALEIMLERGEVGRAKELFEANVDRYPKGRDPIMLDHLVRLGLPASSAKKWLDQSENLKLKGIEGAHYEDALRRWAYTPEA